jgi:CRISPR-associated protein (TIGR03986 family)
MAKIITVQPGIRDPKRAGRAPYNFVPLPENGARWLSGDEIPAAHLDRFEGLSGEIDIELTALTDFYIRGMWSLAEFQQSARDLKPGDKSPAQPLPFLAEGRLRLPGSSLRGMFRTLVEILGRSPLDPVNDQQLFFRAVAATENLDVRKPNSFEPQAKSYKSRVRKEEDAKGGGVFVKAGYLYGSRDEWRIQPARRVAGRQWHQVKLVFDRFGELDKEDCGFRVSGVWFRPMPPGRTGVSRLAEFRQQDTTPGPDWNRGAYVASGNIKGKKSQWIVHEEDRQGLAVKIPQADVTAYQEGGVTPAIRNFKFDYSERSQGVPCFYVEWTDSRGERRVSFGHTHYFRIPYARTTAEAIPVSCRREPGKIDLAQAIFGWVPAANAKSGGDGGGMRGRVSFEDAFLDAAKSPKQDTAPRDVSLTLGSPKPTTYQHYLVQPSERVEDSIHWDGDRQGRGEPVVRGHKLYFHRPGAPLPVKDAPPGAKKDNTITVFRPARSGCVFHAKIRYRNLRDWELGALLAAIELPAGCAHHVGMAKAHGLGSFAVQVTAVREVDRAKRYQSFCAATSSDAAGLECAFAGASGERKQDWRKAFVKRFHDGRADIWADERLAELKALLTYRDLPGNWLNRTRYLEFGRTPDRKTYNEYTHIGYPGRVEMQKRRPLPRASQVVSAPDAQVPGEGRPPLVLRRDD